MRAHVYPKTNLVSPPYTETELHFDIYIDGSYTPPRRDNGYAELPAGWSFVVACNQPIDLGHPVEYVGMNIGDRHRSNNEHTYIVLHKHGSVITDVNAPNFIGAVKHSANTGELSALAEAQLWFLFELDQAYRDSVQPSPFTSTACWRATKRQVIGSYATPVLTSPSHAPHTSYGGLSARIGNLYSGAGCAAIRGIS